MKFSIQICLSFMGFVLAVQAKIVFLNGTEVFDDYLKTVNITTREPVQKWYSVFNPKNISNHSGTKTKIDTWTLNRKHDADERETTTENYDNVSNGTMATRDTTVLSSIRGIWSDISPMLTILSTILGIFLILVLIESPLSPLPVPPLPYPPVGPYPPTNMYPFGVPDGKNHYGIQYAGPPAHGNYRIPRNMQLSNETETMENIIEKVINSITPSSFENFFTSKTTFWTEQLTQSVKSFFINLSTIAESKGSELLQEIAASIGKEDRQRH